MMVRRIVVQPLQIKMIIRIVWGNAVDGDSNTKNELWMIEGVGE